MDPFDKLAARAAAEIDIERRLDRTAEKPVPNLADPAVRKEQGRARFLEVITGPGAEKHLAAHVNHANPDRETEILYQSALRKGDRGEVLTVMRRTEEGAGVSVQIAHYQGSERLDSLTCGFDETQKLNHLHRIDKAKKQDQTVGREAATGLVPADEANKTVATLEEAFALHTTQHPIRGRDGKKEMYPLKPEHKGWSLLETILPGRKPGGMTK